MHVCVRLQGMATHCVSLSLALRLSDALQGHSFSVPVLDLVSAHPWIHFRCSCRHISCLKNTRARTYTQTVDTAQGTFPLHTPSGAPVPVCPCTHDLVYNCTLLSTCSLWSQNGQNISDKGYQMLFWGLLLQCSLADWPTNNYKDPIISAMWKM